MRSLLNDFALFSFKMEGKLLKNLNRLKISSTLKLYLITYIQQLNN